MKMGFKSELKTTATSVSRPVPSTFQSQKRDISSAPAPKIEKITTKTITETDVTSEDITGDVAVADGDISDGDSADIVPDLEQHAALETKKIAQPVVVEVKKEIKTADLAVAARVPPKPAKVSGDCLSAEEEFNQAASKNETPDKLFHIRRALRLCPDDSRFHASLGDIYASLNRATDAQFEYQEALRLAPNDQSLKQKVGSLKTNSAELGSGASEGQY